MVEWSAVAAQEPAVPENPADPKYNWASLDKRVKMAAAEGLTPFVTVHRAPLWAERVAPDNENARLGSRDPDPAEYGKFATALATRYTGNFADPSGPGFLPKVNNWEVWNEPNLLYFLTPQKRNGTWYSPGLYRRLVNAFSSAVYAVDPSSTVIAGVTAPFGNKRQPGPLLFLRKALCLTSTNHHAAGCQGAGALHADAWSTHPYTQGGPTHHAVSPTSVSLGDLPEMKRALNAAVSFHHIISAHPPVQFWVGEFSWDSKPPDPKGVPTALHTRWVSEAVYRSWKAGVRVFNWFTVRDRSFLNSRYQSGLWYCGVASTTDDNVCDNSGYDYSQDVRKPAWRAFWFVFVAYANNGRLTVWGRTPGAQPGVSVAIERKVGSSWRRISLVSANGVGIFSKTFSSSLTKGLVRAHVRGTTDVSAGFSLVRPADRSVLPFGCGPPDTC
jgi:hypothetical protein